MSTNADLYEQDFYTWTQTTAALIRAGKWSDIDPASLAEEVESLGASDKRVLTSQLVRLLAHLLKWHYQPSQRQEGHSWQDSISDARRMIALTIDDSPSLDAYPATRLTFAYQHARRSAQRETRLPLATFPLACPWTLTQVLDDDFWPETSAEATSRP
jgi:hypothetical protein